MPQTPRNPIKLRCLELEVRNRFRSCEVEPTLNQNISILGGCARVFFPHFPHYARQVYVSGTVYPVTVTKNHQHPEALCTQQWERELYFRWASSFSTVQFQFLSYQLLAKIIGTLICLVRETSLSSDVMWYCFSVAFVATGSQATSFDLKQHSKQLQHSYMS